MIKRALLLVLALILGISYVVSAQNELSSKEVVEKPAIAIPDFKVESISNSWGRVSLDTTTINTEIMVNNPNLYLISPKVHCDIYLNDIKMVSELGKDLEMGKCASGSFIRFTSKINNENIPKWWTSHINNGEKTKVKIEGKLTISFNKVNTVFPFLKESHFETDMLKALRGRDLGSIDIGVVKLGIDSLRSQWGKVTLNETEIKHKLTIHNFGWLPVLNPLTDVEYELILNGIEMAKGKTGLHLGFLPGQKRSVTFSSKINNKNIIKWWISHIKNGEKSKHCLKYMLIWIGFIRTPKETCGAFETDIFSQKK